MRNEYRCNKISHTLCRVDDLGSFITLERKQMAGEKLSLKEVFLLDYLNAAYPLSRLEIRACLKAGDGETAELLEHIMSLGESPFDGVDCDCPQCRSARE